MCFSLKGWENSSQTTLHMATVSKEFAKLKVVR